MGGIPDALLVGAGLSLLVVLWQAVVQRAVHWFWILLFIAFCVAWVAAR